MPLLGHAFTGMATALIFDPNATTATRRSSFRSAPFFTTSLVILSYLPDIVSQGGLFFGCYDARKFGHSLIFAALATPIAGMILRRLTSCSKIFCIVLACATILLHDLLDILQSTDRQPLWPFSASIFGSDINIIPTNPTWEALLFGLFYCCVLWWYLRRKKSTRQNDTAPIPYQQWPNRIVVGIIVLAVLFTYQLRLQRIHDFQQAMPYLHRHEYTLLLNMLDQVDRWPRVAKPGRIDYFRGVAYMQQQQMQLAEKYLRRSYRRNKHFFWCVADLALLYAISSDNEGKSLARPFIAELKNNFSTHSAFAEYMKKIKHTARKIKTKKHSRRCIR